MDAAIVKAGSRIADVTSRPDFNNDPGRLHHSFFGRLLVV
jgi:hypothetical protein